MRWLVVLVLVGCSHVTSSGGDDSGGAIQLTVDRHPAAHEITSVEIKRSASTGEEVVDSWLITDAQFPATFELDVRGTGALTIAVDARDGGGFLVGQGTVAATVGDPSATVWLQGVDFVVNSDYGNDQFLTNDYEAAGLQLAAMPVFDTYMIGFRQDCTTCDIYGRRFDGKGYPLLTELAGSAQQFTLSTTAMTPSASPALAATGDRILAFWDFTDVSGSGAGIACRSVDIIGSGTAPITIASEQADVVTASHVPLGDDVVVTWQSFMTTQVVRTMIVQHDCTPVTSPTTVSITPGTTGARRSHVASVGGTVMYAWIVDGDVHVRHAQPDGSFVTGDTVRIYADAAYDSEFVRLAPWGTQFAMAVRSAAPAGMGPGKIAVYAVTPAGNLASPAMSISDDTGSDFASSKAFGLAARDDGTLLVVWAQCRQGPGSCDVLGRYVTPTGAVGVEPFVVATTKAADQINPSVTSLGDDFMVAWNDSSGAEPDHSGQAVRARIIRPDL